MARKEKKYHFIYKTTNLLSGKYYIGMHSTNNLDDGYLGSGNRLRLAIRKHGKDNFKREILEFCNNREELAKREEEIVNLNEIAKVECMNLIVGGLISGFMDEEHQIKCSIAGGEAFTNKVKNNIEFREHHIKMQSEIMKKNHKEGKISYDTNIGFKGKRHSDETKRKMSESSKGKNIGEDSSQYGTCWITKEGINKKIKKEDLDSYINDEWIKGRRMK